MNKIGLGVHTPHRIFKDKIVIMYFNCHTISVKLYISFYNIK